MVAQCGQSRLRSRRKSVAFPSCGRHRSTDREEIEPVFDVVAELGQLEPQGLSIAVTLPVVAVGCHRAGGTQEID
jgi:hypothetical protein